MPVGLTPEPGCACPGVSRLCLARGPRAAGQRRGAAAPPTRAGRRRPARLRVRIFASIFVFFNVFAVNMLLQYRKVGRWRDYLYGERVYMLLSLFANSALAWQVFAGTLRPV